ncbi:MAG TPA: hypothetical protein VE645_11825 [Pseudonocardiaceae bacterium]|jgi:hypothetical protein|nr:hypothetical protein [Pseudonocardiaceae bacterium]
MQADCSDLVIAKRLLDHLKALGFQFQRAALGEDGALVGYRMSDDYLDLIHIEGFSRDCFAWRRRASSLIVPGSGLVERRTDGSALTVLNEVLTWQVTCGVDTPS